MDCFELLSELYPRFLNNTILFFVIILRVLFNPYFNLKQFAMRKSLVIFVAFILLSSSGNAQLWSLRRLELSAATGTTHFFSDIGRFDKSLNYGGMRDVSMANMGLNLAGSVRYRFTKDIAARVNLNYGYLHASDIHGSELKRGFDSYTVFFESALIGEIYVLKNFRENAYLFLNRKRSAPYPLVSYIDLYVLTGIGAFSWDVTPNPALAFHVRNSSGMTAVIPVGIGIARQFSGKFKGGAELSARYALKDDLEGFIVKNTGNDAAYFLNVVLTWRLKTKRYPTF